MPPVDSHRTDVPDHPTDNLGRPGLTPTVDDDLRVEIRILSPGSASRRARAVVREALLDAGVDEGAASDAEAIAAELASNCEKHARPPYELRILSLGDVPVWCEIIDGDPDLKEVSRTLDALRVAAKPHDIPAVEEGVGSVVGEAEELDLFSEGGRGLLLAHVLSEGRCRVYRTRTVITGTPGKAVAFALPPSSGRGLPFCSLVDASFSYSPGAGPLG